MAVASTRVRVHVFYDPEVESYWANSPDLEGLVVTGATRAELREEARLAAETLLDLAGIDAVPELTFQDAQYRPE